MRISDWSSDVCSSDLVGDVSQTIYSFTGATPRYLTDFRRKHPEAAVVRLVRDYRSTPQVVRLANEVLERAGRHRNAADRQSVVVGKECVSTCRSRWSPVH